MLAPAFVRAVHAEHGEPVVFTPGELLPDWAAEALEAGHGKFVDEGVIELNPPARESPPAGRKTRPKETTA
jgi:hypothetical protein